MSDYISRADAIEHLKNVKVSYPHADISLPIDLAIKAIEILPSAETHEIRTETHGVCLISKDDAIEAVRIIADKMTEHGKVCMEQAVSILEALPSADAEPKWNCTANFVAEQLDRLRKMTDEEKWEFFKRFFEIKGGDKE